VVKGKSALGEAGLSNAASALVVTARMSIREYLSII
jgi:hypothetical protein